MEITNFKSRSYLSNEPEIIAEKQREKDIFSSFAGQKVKIGYTNRMDMFSSAGEKTGKIIPKDNGFMFIPSRSRTRGYNITLGLYDGFYATLTINKIEKI